MRHGFPYLLPYLQGAGHGARPTFDDKPLDRNGQSRIDFSTVRPLLPAAMPETNFPRKTCVIPNVNPGIKADSASQLPSGIAVRISLIDAATGHDKKAD